MSTTTLGAFWEQFATTTLETFGGLNGLFVLIFQTFLIVAVIMGLIKVWFTFFKK